MSANGNGHYWSKFCWRDWYNDRALRRCSIAARGLWMDCLCVMHEATPIGYLTVDGSPMPMAEIARNAGISTRLSSKLMAELEANNVYSIDEKTGVIFSRRMVKDAQASEIGRKHAEKRFSTPSGVASGEGTGGAPGDPFAKSLESESELELELYASRRDARRAGANGSKQRFRSGALDLMVREGGFDYAH